MKEIVEKKEVEELLGCEITDEQFEEALKYARHKQEYIYQRERRQVVLLKPNHANMIGSYLYKFDEHKIPIAGNILFVGEEWTRDGIDFCGIEDETFKLLHLELKNMVMAMKATKEAMNL